MSWPATGRETVPVVAEEVVAAALSAEVLKAESEVGAENAAGLAAMSFSAPWAGCAGGVLSCLAGCACDWACGREGARVVSVGCAAVMPVPARVAGVEGGRADAEVAVFALPESKKLLMAASSERVGGLNNSHPQNSKSRKPHQQQVMISRAKRGPGLPQSAGT